MLEQLPLEPLERDRGDLGEYSDISLLLKDANTLDVEALIIDRHTTTCII